MAREDGQVRRACPFHHVAWMIKCLIVWQRLIAQLPRASF